jgi:hypothetical protein
MLDQALNSMQAALDLLDQAEAPPHIGAHLDLAICELQRTISALDVSDAGEFKRSA